MKRAENREHSCTGTLEEQLSLTPSPSPTARGRGEQTLFTTQCGRTMRLKPLAHRMGEGLG
ncbi:hypothetical protein JOD20_000048 [Herpetosiphon giganteus]|nr:hypothetical protein [Herpetosiphon giganteus]